LKKSIVLLKIVLLTMSLVILSSKSFICCAEESASKSADSASTENKQEDNSEFDFIKKNKSGSSGLLEYTTHIGIGLIVLGGAGVIYVCYPIFKNWFLKRKKNNIKS
jgi:hypothetical protein